MYSIVRVFWVLFAYIKLTNSCSCMMAHPQQNFCHSDFVISAVPESQIDVDHFTVQYKINIKDTFKMTPEAKTSLIDNLITTAADSATCGIKLELNTQYLLSGSTHEGVARINLCGWNTLWKDVGKYQEKGLKSEYEKGCSCNISPCFTADECNPKQENACLLDQFATDRSCYDNFSSCISTDGQCNWTKNEHFLKCSNSPLDLQQAYITKK